MIVLEVISLITSNFFILFYYIINMINYIFNEDSEVLSIFSPTGEYTMLTPDNKNFYLVVNKIRKPETEWADIDALISNKIFNLSLGFISMFENDGDIFYQILGEEPKRITGRLFQTLINKAYYSCNKLYFTRILNFISEHEDLIPIFNDEDYCIGLSKNLLPVIMIRDDNGYHYQEVDKIPTQEEKKNWKKIKNSNISFFIMENGEINKADFLLRVIDFLKKFWKRDDYKKLKKLSLSIPLQNKFRNDLSIEFDIFDNEILNLTYDFMNDEYELCNFLYENVVLK